MSGRVRSPNAPRYAYDLTPKGFAEKSHLAAEYLTSFFAFFRRADMAFVVRDICARPRLLTDATRRLIVQAGRSEWPGRP